MQKGKHEAEFHHILENLPAAAYSCDSTGLITWFNKNAVELWGRVPKLNDPADRFCGSFALFSTDGPPIPHDRCWMAQVLQTGKEYSGEIVIARPDGSQITVLAHVQPIHDDSGRLAGAVNILVDVTASKRGEEAQARLSAIIDSCDDAIVAKTLDGTITAWNRGAELIFGYTETEALGRHISLIIPEDRRQEEDDVLARLRRGEKIDHFETIRQTKDGRRIEVSLTVSPVRNAAGRIIGASKVARDITDRKRQEQLLRDADRAKDEFLATLSHELRTPLNAILGWARIARNQWGTVERALEIIERNAKQQARLIDDLLDMSRIVNGKLQLQVASVDIPHVIVGAVDSLRLQAEAKGVGLDLRIGDELPLILADEQRLHQVFSNLVENAIKFTPKGGRVAVEVRKTTSRVEIRVIDTGGGISTEFLSHVFEPFRQNGGASDRKGLGLGLAIVRRLVELHGGTVGAESEGEGKGAVFSVTLPLKEERRTNTREFGAAVGED